MGKAWKHFCTITRHKNLVMAGCFKVGLYKQGLLHDLSKYGPTEFFVGCKYYQGFMSPNNAERKDKGYSSAWLHHKGRNKHHLEYWVDYGVGGQGESDATSGMVGMKMPMKYVVEMFIDRVSASKNYQGKEYQSDSAWRYYNRGKGHYTIHEDTRALLELLLIMTACEGEEYAFHFVKTKLLKGQIPYDKAYLQELAAPYYGKAQNK